MKRMILAALVPMIAAFNLGVFASEGEAHAHKAPHGGIVKSAGKYHIELVVTQAGFDVYLLDAKEQTLPVEGVTGKATGLTKAKAKLDLNLNPQKDHLFAQTDPEALEGGTLVIALHKGTEAISAKFKPGEHSHPDEHAHH